MERRDHETRFQVKGDQPQGKPVCVALPLEIDAIVRSLPNRSDWLRKIITEAVEKLKKDKDDE